MQQIYPDPELILYFYGELDPEKKLELENRLEKDFTFREKFNSLKSVMNLLSENCENPHPTTVDIIMEYSKTKSRLQKATQH